MKRLLRDIESRRLWVCTRSSRVGWEWEDSRKQAPTTPEAGRRTSHADGAREFRIPVRGIMVAVLGPLWVLSPRDLHGDTKRLLAKWLHPHRSVLLSPGHDLSAREREDRGRNAHGNLSGLQTPSGDKFHWDRHRVGRSHRAWRRGDTRRRSSRAHGDQRSWCRESNRGRS